MAGVAAYHDESNLDSKDLRPYWWGVWFEFFLLVLNVVALVMGAREVHSSFQFFCFFIVVRTALAKHLSILLISPLFLAAPVWLSFAVGNFLLFFFFF